SRLRVKDLTLLSNNIGIILADITPGELNTFTLMMAIRTLRTNLLEIKKMIERGGAIDFDKIDIFTNKD
ncbi:MAG: hypothetical protein HDS02_08350, partial [Bacteroides sp.]|nr:hypothetical protein [Bacteroides sp.]